MRLHLAWIQARPGRDKLPAYAALTDEYLTRVSRYCPTEAFAVSNEAALVKLVPKTHFIALDSRGKQLGSEQLSAFLRDHQDRGTQTLLFAVGGADGFSEDTLKRAQLKLSLGAMTLPHELARVVLLEQLYRAFTILKGHPYHTGH